MPTQRPPSLVLGAGLAVVGGLAAFGTASTAMANGGYGGIATGMRRFVTVITSSDAGADTLLRLWLMTIVALGIAAMVLGGYVFVGHRGSWWGLSVVGLVALVVMGFTSVAAVFVTALALGQLWSRPSRHWMGVLDGPAPVDLGASPVLDAGERVEPTSTVAVRRADHMPSSVVVALLAVVLSSLLAFVGALFVSAVMLLARSRFLEDADRPEVRRFLDAAHMTAETSYWYMICLLSVTAAASFVALVLAAVASARGGPAVSMALTAMCAVALLIGVLWLPVSVPFMGAAIVAMIKLNSTEARQWFARRRTWAASRSRTPE